MAGFAFVDDTDLIVTDDSQDERMVTSKMQQSLNLWHGLLKVTGGDLVPEKCFWYLIDFTWGKDSWQYTKWKDQDRTLSIPSSDGTKITIPRLDTTEARRTLGVRLAPDGNNLAEYQHLREETIRWKNQMITSNLPRAAADFGIRHVLLPKLRYPLVATTFSEAQCHSIMQPVLQQGLPALGVNRNFPRAVAFGPTTYQGLNLPNLHTEQLISHILTMLKYGNLTDDPTGSLIRTCGELFRLEVGVCGPLFLISPYFRVCTTDTWFAQCWFECIQRGIQIDDNIPDLSILRERDFPIMEVFLRSGYRNSELMILNRCRMHLHVIFLSDICNGQGTAIEPQFWKGQTQSDVHDYLWPRTHKPAPGEWALWQHALSTSLNLSTTHKLATPLGQWLPSTLSQNGWFTTADGLQLYKQTNHEWFSFTPLPVRRRLRTFMTTPIPTQEQHVPSQLMRATVFQHGSSATITGYGPIRQDRYDSRPTPLEAFWIQQQCLLTEEGDLETLFQAILSGTAVAVSNGSFKDQEGAAAWTIEGPTAANRIVGHGITPGEPADQSAYRSELFGIWGILASLKQLSEKMSTTGMFLLRATGNPHSTKHKASIPQRRKNRIMI